MAFLDTNILYYAVDKGEPLKRAIASKLVQSLGDSEKGCLSTQVLLEFVSVAKKRADRPRREISDSIDWVSSWNVHQPRVADILSALAISDRFQISIWDAMIVNSAIVLGCSILYTEDLNHGQVIDGVQIINPFFAEEPNPA